MAYTKVSLRTIYMQSPTVFVIPFERFSICRGMFSDVSRRVQVSGHCVMVVWQGLFMRNSTWYSKQVFGAIYTRP
jgi:hypothetical protein